MNYEDLLNAMGGCGRYQVILVLLLTYFTFQIGLEHQIMFVSLYKQPFECVTTSNTSSEDKCHFFNGSGGVQPCKDWRYSRDVMQETLVIEYDLVCENRYWINLLFSLHGFGRCVVGVFGFLPDIVGRRPLILFSLAAKMIYFFLVPSLTSFRHQLAVRMLKGASPLLTRLSLIVAIESVPQQYRGWVGGSFYTPWAFGYMFAALVSYLVRKWRRIYSICAFTTILNIPVFFLYPESLRWLLVKGKFKEARKLIRKISWINGVKLDEKSLEDIHVEDNEIREPFYLLFTRPTICIRTLLITFGKWSLLMGYYGLSMDLNFASSNIFINIALMGLMELPAGPISSAMMGRIGRRASFTICLAVTIICIVAVPFLSFTGSQEIIRGVIALLGKLSLTTAFNVTEVWYSEMLPTSLRSSATCFFSLVGGIGALLTPYITDMKELFFASPSLLFSCQLVICMITHAMFFPETFNLLLPDIAEDANNLWKSNENEWQKVMMAKRIAKSMECNNSQMESQTSAL